MELAKDIRIDLDSKIWGRHGWFFIDSIGLAYPQNPTPSEKLKYLHLFYSFDTILPCTKCRHHWGEYLKSNPLNDTILKSKDNLIKWLLGAHNNVNHINNTKIISLKDFYTYYNTQYKINVKKDTCLNTCGLKNINTYHSFESNNNYKYISIILFGIIIALGLFIFRQNQLMRN